MANQQMNITIKAFDKTKAGLGSAAKGIKAVAGTVLNLKTALIGVAGVAGFGMMIRSSMQATDSLGKTARKIGVTTEALAKMRYAAHLTGVSTQTMDMALQRFTRRAAEAARGTGEAKDALRELGVNAREIIKLPLEDQMAQLASAFEEVETEADKVRLAMKLFDSEGVALVNTLGLGEEALREMAGEAAALGLTMSGDAVQGVEDANDAFSKLGFLFKGVRDQLTGALAPALENFANFLTGKLKASIDEAGGSVEGFAQNLAIKIIEGFQSLFKGLAEILNAIGRTAHEIKSIYRSLFSSADTKRNEAELKKLEQAAIKAGISLNMAFDPDSNYVDRLSDANRQIVKDINRIQNELNQIENREAIPYKPIDFSEIDEGFERVKTGIMEVQEAKQNAQIQDDENAELNKQKGEEQTRFDLYNADLKATAEQNLSDFKSKNLGEQTKDVLGNLSTQLGAYKGQSKKLFALAKTAAIGKAIINTYEGATKAISAYPPPINFAMAAATVAGGLAQVSAIRAQSFDGGGFTGSGSRTGGVDGKGGFPAILHPNETVIDHTKPNQRGTNEPVVVNQTINVSTGVEGTVRAEIQNLMPQIAEAAQSAVLGARMRGGSYSKSLLGN